MPSSIMKSTSRMPRNGWTEDKREDYAITKTKKDIYDAMQSLEYEINTLFTSNGQNALHLLVLGWEPTFLSRKFKKAILNIRIMYRAVRGGLPSSLN